MVNNPIIIGGFYRSGTSLVRRLMDAHSNIHCPPEIKFMKDFYGDYLDDPLAHGRFFGTLRTIGLPEDELLQIMGRAYIECRQRACALKGKTRWADKNPENLLYLSQWKEVLGDFSFVFVVRDPLDALASLCEIGFEKTVPISFRGKVDLIKGFLRKGIDYSKCYSESSFILHYERLVRDPDEELRRLFNFLGERYEPDVKERFFSSDRVSGVEDPKVKKSDKIYTSSVGRWREVLNVEQAAVAINELAPVSARLGYDFSYKEAG